MSCKKKDTKLEPSPTPISTPAIIGDVKLQLLCSCTPGHTMYPSPTVISFYNSKSNLTTNKVDFSKTTNNNGIVQFGVTSESFIYASATSTFECSTGQFIVRTNTIEIKPVTSQTISSTLILLK